MFVICRASVEDRAQLLSVLDYEHHLVPVQWFRI
jgi:hypothetical protein